MFDISWGCVGTAHPVGWFDASVHCTPLIVIAPVGVVASLSEVSSVACIIASPPIVTSFLAQPHGAVFSPGLGSVALFRYSQRDQMNVCHLHFSIAGQLASNQWGSYICATYIYIYRSYWYSVSDIQGGAAAERPGGWGAPPRGPGGATAEGPGGGGGGGRL